MGKWTLENLNGTSSPLNGQTFGTNFHAYYRLRYTPSRGRFTEIPRLDWHEKIHMKEHHNGEWWEFETNMYTHNPTSRTLLIWPRRYVEAYNHANGELYSAAGGMGSCQLLDKDDQPVSVNDLGQNINGEEQRADAVRSYLRRNGGILLIEIHDIPSINLPTGNEHKERLLVFNCGIEGNDDLRLKAEQYLDVDAATGQNQWQREFNMTWQKSWATRGLNKVDPPAIVSNPRVPTFAGGEVW